MPSDRGKNGINQRMFSGYGRGRAFETERDVFRFQYDMPMDGVNIQEAMRKRAGSGGFFIGQITDIQTAPGSIVPEHVQQVDEISYIFEGRCHWKVNDEELECEPGDVLINRTGDVHSYITDHLAPVRVFNVGLLYSDCGDTVFTQVWGMLSNCKTPMVVRGKSEVGKMFLRIFEETSNQSEYWQYAVSLQIKQMILMIYRDMINERLSAYNPKGYMESRSALFYQVINYMDRHIEEMHALNNMSEEFHYSYSYLSHMFKSIMGYPMSTYYRQRRFAHAAKLLSDDSLSITDISRRMGFQTVHAFSKAFKKHFGICPTKYIESQNEMEDWNSSGIEQTIISGDILLDRDIEDNED